MFEYFEEEKARKKSMSADLIGGAGKMLPSDGLSSALMGFETVTMFNMKGIGVITGKLSKAGIVS